MTSEQLVSVVIPAYNSAGTLDETLRSVRAQTHTALEIIVVNDGSTDDTGRVAAAHAAMDTRVRVLTQRNAGLAETRNTGWRSARGEVIAFVDADDLWSPTKIERQLHALQARGPRAGLAYCWYARIDAESLVEYWLKGVRHEGNVLPDILAGNFIGNGSSALVRREALEAIDGFAGALRTADAQGCEDWLAYCRIAEHYEFVVVPEHLVGYRNHPQNMSSNRPRMMRSWIMVHDIMMQRQPAHAATLQRSVRHYGAWLVQNAMSLRAFVQVPSILTILFARYPAAAIAVLMWRMPYVAVCKIARRVRGLALFRGTSAVNVDRRFPIGSPRS